MNSNKFYIFSKRSNDVMTRQGFPSEEAAEQWIDKNCVNGVRELFRVVIITAAMYHNHVRSQNIIRMEKRYKNW